MPSLAERSKKEVQQDTATALKTQPEQSDESKLLVTAKQATASDLKNQPEQSDPTKLQVEPIQDTYGDLKGTVKHEKNKATTVMHNAVALTVDDTTTSSAELDCSQAKKFLLGYDLTETGTLVDGDRVRINVQFRKDSGTWRDYQVGPFVSLYEEESTTPCNRCVSGDCVGENIRVQVVTDYTNTNPTANYFTITAEITLME